MRQNWEHTLEINLASPAVRRYIGGSLLVCLFLAIMLLGRSVTPVMGDRPQLLTPERWQAANLSRKANAEIRRLVADAQELRALGERETLDPIQAMTLAQHIYARQRNGTAATSQARQKLIAAAEMVARYGGGGVKREAALQAVNEALQRIQVLIAPTADFEPKGSLGNHG